jgi:hypothetical protein
MPSALLVALASCLGIPSESDWDSIWRQAAQQDGAVIGADDACWRLNFWDLRNEISEIWEIWEIEIWEIRFQFSHRRNLDLISEISNWNRDLKNLRNRDLEIETWEIWESEICKIEKSEKSKKYEKSEKYETLQKYETHHTRATPAPCFAALRCWTPYDPGVQSAGASAY